MQPGGKIAARFDDHSINLGTFRAIAAADLRNLQVGVPLKPLTSARGAGGTELDALIRRLAQRGLLEYAVGRSRSSAQVVIEPQTPDYWPNAAPLRDTDRLVLSRFAYLRRRGNDVVLESPRAAALFRISEPKLAVALVALSQPQQVKRLRGRAGAIDIGLLALLLDCQILLKVDRASDKSPRAAEGDDDLVLWDFHDLLFHARSTEGRHANPVGGLYPHDGAIAPLPAVRPTWPGKSIDLKPLVPAQASSPFVDLLRKRHSTRAFDDERPITLAELARFLDGAARVLAKTESVSDGAGDTEVYTARPYPSAGASHALELYLAVGSCEGLARGFYHYDAGAHALTPIDVPAGAIEAQLMRAAFAMGASSPPQILITIAARFGRMSWKYSSIAYALILKDVGVLTQTLYLMATDLGLGGCAIGVANVDQFAKMTGLNFHVEGPVGQFALGRAAVAGASD
jgi:SagB-type dehydrogenase family enzyme